MDDYVKDFVQESEEQITELNNALLDLEQDPDDDEAIEQVFRTAHTLKGNAGAMGFNGAADLAHALEDLLEGIRSGSLEPTPELMDQVFAGVDELERLVDETREHGEPKTDPTPTIEQLREHAALTSADDDEIDDLLATVDEPASDAHEVYHARLAIAPGEGNGGEVVDALEDAFDLLGSSPSRAAVESGDFEDRFDVVFASPVGKGAIDAALAPVQAVDDAIVTQSTDRFQTVRSDDGGAADAGESTPSTDAPTGPAPTGEGASAEDMSVDELLADEDVDQFDDLDAAMEDLADEGDDEGFDDLGDAGSFDDLDLGEDLSSTIVDDDAAPAVEPGTDESDVDGDDAAEADAEPEPPAETDSEPATADAAAADDAEEPEPAAAADDEDVEDASATFAELQEEVDPVGFDELQDELAELEFDEFDTDEEVGFDELIGDEVDVEDESFLDFEGEAVDDEAIDDMLVDEDTTAREPESADAAEAAGAADADSPDTPETPDAPESAEEPGTADAADAGDATETADADASAAESDARTEGEAFGDVDFGEAGTAGGPADGPETEGGDDVGFDDSSMPSVDADAQPAEDDFGDDFDDDGFDDFADDLGSGLEDDSFGEDDDLADDGFGDSGSAPETDDFGGFDEFEEFADEDADEAEDTPDPVESLDIVTEQVAGDLRDAGVETVQELAGAEVPVLAGETGLSVTELADLVEAAGGTVEADLTAASPGSTGAASDEMQSVRVDVDRVDDLLNLVEGLVTSRARLRRAVDEGESLGVIDDELDELEDITAELQDTVMDVRLVPLNTVTSRLPRIVRDVARDQDKQVDFGMVGEDVELDRTVLTEIGDPLIHLVRNAVDHGIEHPDRREAMGKDPTGSIEIRAERERDEVVIEIEDDGSGLDPDDLRAEAVEEGILTEAEAADMSESEAYDLVFHPGFSTREEVTDVSGRGVGMDVVASTVSDLDGEVDVESTLGEGTTVRLTLPVTVAIADVLFVEVGGEEYGIPVRAVQEIGPVRNVETIDGMEVVVTEEDDEDVIFGGVSSPDDDTTVRRESPLLRLDDALETPRRGRNGDGRLVHVREDVREVVLHCDDIRGRQEVVVKPFDGLLGDIPGLTGAAVLGEGEVVNILDVETL